MLTNLTAPEHAWLRSLLDTVEESLLWDEVIPYGLAVPRRNGTLELVNGEERDEPAFTMTDAGPFPLPDGSCGCREHR